MQLKQGQDLIVHFKILDPEGDPIVISEMNNVLIYMFTDPRGLTKVEGSSVVAKFSVLPRDGYREIEIIEINGVEFIKLKILREFSSQFKIGRMLAEVLVRQTDEPDFLDGFHTVAEVPLFTVVEAKSAAASL